MRNKILAGVVAAGLVFAMSACSDITSINKNPNGPTDVAPPAILSGVIQAAVNGVDGVNSLNVRGAGLFAQYYSEIQYRDEDRYILREVDGGWGFYSGALEDAQRMITKGTAEGVPNWEAVGRIMKSYIYGVMTDAMGDIPYSEALKGDTVLQPKYDSQQSIYTALFADLKAASDEIAPAGIGFATGDLMYNGDMSEWKKFANSLRLRLAMHLTNVDAATAQSEAAAAVAAGVFDSNADNAQLLYLASPPNQNPIYNNAKSRDDYGMSQTYVDSLLSWNDPRLPVFAQPNANGVYQGLQNGLLGGPPLSDISRIGALWRETPDAPMALLTYSEVLFLEAEAAERGWITDNPATLYNAAITASMEQYGVAAADIATYLAQPRVQYAGGQAGLDQIAYQKWVTLFMQGMEGRTEWRRTQFPTLVPGPD
ncbi:MAG: SusD/RagB family nutrient-binding outer membrane lipoprotein, partial [Gemmatimonadota bacterium]